MIETYALPMLLEIATMAVNVPFFTSSLYCIEKNGRPPFKICSNRTVDCAEQLCSKCVHCGATELLALLFNNFEDETERVTLVSPTAACGGRSRPALHQLCSATV